MSHYDIGTYKHGLDIALEGRWSMVTTHGTISATGVGVRSEYFQAQFSSHEATNAKKKS